MVRRLWSMQKREQGFQQFERWGFDEKGWSPVTRHKYVRRLRAADAWLTANKGVSVLMAGVKDLKAYLFSTSATARNRNNIRQALVGGGEFAVDQGYQQVNQALGLPRLPEPEPLPRALDVEQGRRIAAACKNFGPLVETLVLTFLYAGLRRNEARLLEWRHVESEATWLKFEGKGQRQRVVPVHPRLRDALLFWAGQCPDPQWLFPSPRGIGKPMGETHLRLIVVAVGETAGIQELHPHALRHTFATRLVELGVHLRTIQESLGHADPKSTSIYTHVRPPEMSQDIKKLDF